MMDPNSANALIYPKDKCRSSDYIQIIRSGRADREYLMVRVAQITDQHFTGFAEVLCWLCLMLVAVQNLWNRAYKETRSYKTGFRSCRDGERNRTACSEYDETVPAGVRSAIPAGVRSAVPGGVWPAVPAGVRSAVPAGVRSAVPAGVRSMVQPRLVPQNPTGCQIRRHTWPTERSYSVQNNGLHRYHTCQSRHLARYTYS